MKLYFSIDKLFPFLRWGRNLDKDTVRADALAGLTGAALVLPQGVAFATIAGMPPEYGIYAGMVPAVIAALFGSSWHLVSGPTTAASIVMFSSLSTMAVPGSAEYVSLAITLAFMVGILQVVMGFARLGTLVNFISHSVIVGFTAGAALMIAAKQFKIFLGLELPGSKHLHEQLIYLWDNMSAFHPMVAVVGISTLLTTIVCKRKWPHLPGMVIAMLVGSVIGVALNYFFGEARTGIKMIGALPGGLPPLSMPDFSVVTMKELAPLTVAMTLFALTEAVSIARSIAIKSGQSIQGNQEFIGQGLSNIAGSFFSAYVATGSFNRSGANYEAGAVTPLSSILAGCFLILMIPLIAPLTAYLPISAVAGILITVAWRIVDFKQIKKIAQADRKEFLIMSVTFISTIFLELEFAILLGILLSLILFLRNTSRPRLVPRVPDPESAHRKFTSGVSRDECPQFKMLRLEDSIYFGSVSHISELFRLYREKYPDQKHLFLLTKGINQVDVAGAELLANEVRARRKMGGDFYMYRLKDVASKVMKDGGYLDEIGEENIFDSKEEAIETVFDKLDKNICAGCKNRIFVECKSVPFTPEPNQSPAVKDSSAPKSES